MQPWAYHGQKRPPFAVSPGPGQESVWDYPRPPRLEADQRRITVWAGARRLADSQRSYRVLETASPPTFYLPPADVDVSLLKGLSGATFCEWKGAARYWTLAGVSEERAVAWAYPDPSAAYRAIAGYFAFFPGAVACYVDGERVRPQPGVYYGGWVTSELVGPFKGDPGTGDW